MEEKEKKEQAAHTDKESPTYAGLMLSLRDFRGRLVPERHFLLNTSPREIDVCLIDNLSPDAERMDNAIAYIFERHNLVELKNPNEQLNIDTFWKGISYAAQYKSLGSDKLANKQGVDAIPAKSVTFTFLRLSKPEVLLKWDLPKDGFSVTKAFPGVYHISGLPSIKMQIVVGKELEGDVFMPLRVQKENTNRADIEKLIEFMASIQKGTEDKEFVETVFRASFGANRSLYAKIREEMPEMCDELREFMKDDFDAVARDTAQSMIDSMVNYMNQKGYEQDEITDFTEHMRNAVKVGAMA